MLIEADNVKLREQLKNLNIPFVMYKCCIGTSN